MAIQTINLGNYANDGTGDDLRTAFVKVNANFAALDNEISVSEGRNVGSGTGVYKDKDGLYLDFKSLTSVNNTVVLTSNTNTVDLSVTTHLSNDPAPALGANLNLSGRLVYNGNVSALSWGIDPLSVYSLLSILITSNPNINFDFGDQMIEAGALEAGQHGFSVDMNGTGFPAEGFVNYTPPNSYDFGTFG